MAPTDPGLGHPGTIQAMTGYVAMGSNLGDRGTWLASALGRLDADGIGVGVESSVWETEAVGIPGAGAFWNMVVEIETSLTPREILERLQRIEQIAGRRRSTTPRSRTLDLDLLTLGDLHVDDERLTLPHPRMWQRSFVLAPLNEVAPELRNPKTGRTPAQELARIPHPTAVSRIGALAPRATVLL